MPVLFRPPQGASLLLRLFAGETDFPQIEGDLREEFHQKTLVSGDAAARRWYWRETLRNVWVFARTLGTFRILVFAGICAAALYWSPWLISLGQYSLSHILFGFKTGRPRVVINLPIHLLWAIRSNGAVYAVPSPDFWIYPAFQAVISMCFGILATRTFIDKVWLLRMAILGWNVVLLANFPVNPALFGACWFLVGSAYCSQRLRRQLAV